MLVVFLPGSSAADDEPVFRKRLRLPVAGDQLGYAAAVAADPHTGEIFVCDSRQDRIIIFDSQGRFEYQIEGGGNFRRPLDIAVDPEGYILLAASQQIRSSFIELDFDGLFLRAFDLSELPEGYERPYITSLALSQAGDRIYSLDSTNLVVWISDRDGKFLRLIELAEGLDEEERQEVILRKVDVSGPWVTVPIPMEGTVRVFSLDGDFVGRYGAKGTGPCRIGFPVAAAVDNQGNLVVIDQQRMMILRWSRSEGCLGEYYGIGDAPGYLYFPLDGALDREGRLFVSQGYQGRVQMYEGLSPVYGAPEPDTSSEAAD